MRRWPDLLADRPRQAFGMTNCSLPVCPQESNRRRRRVVCLAHAVQSRLVAFVAERCWSAAGSIRTHERPLNERPLLGSKEVPLSGRL